MLFARNKPIEPGSFMEGLLDALGSRLVIVREGKCEVLHSNAAARKAFQQPDALRCCQTLVEKQMPGLCAFCPNNADDCQTGPGSPYLEARDGHWYTVETASVDWMDGKPAVLMALHSADADQSNAQKLYQLAYMDSLTGLPNREKLKTDFAQSLKSSGDGVYRAVAMFDMDYFKLVNDTYGHSTGNVLLKRLAQHLQANPEFKGHLYRLGGDEFAFFLSLDKSRYPAEADMRRYCEGLFQNAFYSYTMPNIELECTISMGVSYAPAHGETLTELLRKADIALYKAKDEGRNRMVIFEEWYDTARKFTDYFINIRPVLSTASHTYGYELTDNTLSAGDDRTINLNMLEFNRAIEALEPGDLDSGYRYFIHYSHQLGNPAISQQLPAERFIVQLPERCTAMELSAFRDLRAMGFLLSVQYTAGLSADMLRLADYVRVTADSLSQAAPLIRLHSDKQFIAVGVDSQQIHTLAVRAGFQLYQGQFFGSPVVVRTGKDIDPLKLNYFRLLALASGGAAVNFKEISEIVSADMALTYKLLRLLNSAAVGLRNRISSVSMAVAYLGEESLKKWIALLAMRGLMSDKPMEIVRMSLIRARFAELLAEDLRPRWDPNQAFLSGMFSLLHIAMDTSRDILLDQLSLSDNIRQSLLTSSGPYSALIEFFSQYEYANWDEVAVFARQYNLSCQQIYGHYIASVKWFNLLAGTESAIEMQEPHPVH
ncbi:diguanylate cyclase [Ruminococcaceae bacterium OttesenSCG-928-L11]|nr:diguanylate cyclase [Ruminococcaceae bacterium OttesenSCG-928-L11]